MQMGFFKINAALLALMFSVLAEALFCLCHHFFGVISTYGSPQNFMGWLFFYFHVLPDSYLSHLEFIGGCLFCIPAIFFQWWIIFFFGILVTRLIARQHDPKILKGIIILLVLMLITLLGFLVHSQFWQNSNWKAQINLFVMEKAFEEAKKDFQAGKLKTYIIAGKCDTDKYSGTNDGPFAVWITHYYPSYYPDRFIEEKRVEFYNMEMRGLYKRTLTETNLLK